MSATTVESAASNAPGACATVTEIDAATLKEWLDRGEAVLVDVRESDEHARERLAAAALHPLSRLDPVVLADAGRGTKRLVLHCKGGRRSMEAAGRVVQAASCEVYSLKGGLDGWKAVGLPVVADRSAPLPIIRQVQMTVGVAVLAGSVLAALVSPWFLVLTGFFGAGLLFAGATGTCGLAAMLGAMPWNRLTAPPGAAATRQRLSGCCGGSCARRTQN